MTWAILPSLYRQFPVFKGKKTLFSLYTLLLRSLFSFSSSRTLTDRTMELDSACKNPSSSVKRRRTTQVINITMTKVEETHLHTYCMFCMFTITHTVEDPEFE